MRLALIAASGLLATVLGCATAEERPSPEPAAEDGHRRMVALLNDVAARTETEHPLLSERASVELRARLAALPPDAHPRDKVRLHMALGEESLRQNRLEEGLEYLEAAYRDVTRFLELGIASPKAVYSVAYRLGVGSMRLGETRNCCLRHAPESCLLPIRGGGLHEDRTGSERASGYFSRVLELAPPDSDVYFDARWLLNIAAMTLDRYPDGVPGPWRIPETTFRSTAAFPRLPNRAPELGLATFDLAGGAAIEDFDGDGLLDLFVSTYDPTQSAHLFVNDGEGGFVERSREANLEGLLGGFNLVHADYDNDGDDDVLILRGAWLGAAGAVPNSLLRNDGRGRFTDVTFEAGLGEVHYPTQTASWADYDNDGDLDVYIGNESVADLQPPCQLFRNNGDGTFSDVAAAAGVTNDRFAKSVAWGDYDDDGDPDLYVSNLGEANRLYRNAGDGTFRDVALESGVAGPSWSFASWFWDYDNDGDLDLFSAAYPWSNGGLASVVRSALGEPPSVETAALYRNEGDGRFVDVGAASGLDRVVLPMGANFGDLDNDGWLDAYLGTGYPDYEALMPNAMLRNKAGAGFEDVTYAAGLGHLQKGHAVVFADLDQDGDLDLFHQVGGFFYGDRFANALFENPGNGNRWLALELSGREANRSAIGARLRIDFVEGGEPRSVHRVLSTGGSFGSNPLRQTIGLGRAEKIERLTIRWPGSDTVRVIEGVPLDRLVRVVEGVASHEVIEQKAVPFGANRAQGSR